MEAELGSMRDAGGADRHPLMDGMCRSSLISVDRS